MIFIKLFLEEGSHLSQFLIALSLYALNKVHEFPVVLICDSEFVPKFHSHFLLSLHLLIHEVELCNHFRETVSVLVCVEL